MHYRNFGRGPMKIILLGCETIPSSKSMQTLTRNPLRSTLGRMMGDMICNTTKFNMMPESYWTNYISNFQALLSVKSAAMAFYSPAVRHCLP